MSSLTLLRNIPYGVLGTFVVSAVVFAGGALNFAVYYGAISLFFTLWLGFRLRR